MESLTLFNGGLWLNLATPRRDSQQTRRCCVIRSEYDVAIFTPSPATIIWRVAKRYGRASRNGNLFQLAVCEKGDPLTIGRKKRIRSAVGSLKWCRLQLVQAPNVELTCSVLFPSQRQYSAIR